MKRFIICTLILVLGLVAFGSSGVSYAEQVDPGGSSPLVCPAGTKPDPSNASCAQCAHSEGCIGSQTDPATTCTATSCNIITTYLNPLITLLSGLVGLACVISLILAGVQYTTSAGDPQRASAAKSRIVNTLIAFLAFIFLWAFLQFLIPGGILNPGN